MIVVAQHLDDLAARINDATSAAERSARAAVAHALEAGSLLLQAKGQVAHGDWQQWIEANCDVAPRTAQAYMRLAKHWPTLPEEKRRSVADMPLREAITAIATSPTAPPSPPRLKPQMGDITELRPVFKSAGNALNSIASDVGLRSIKSDRIKALRDKLQAALAALDKMTEAAQ